MFRLYRFALPFSLLLLASLACSVDLGNATPTPPPTAPAVLKDLGIEAPLPNSQLPFGPVEVKSYAWSDAGITQAELDINGVAVRTDPVASEKVNGLFTLTHITQQWTPPGPGTYTLAVRVQDGQGNWFTINTITVQIVEAGQASATLPVAGASDTPTATVASDASATEAATASPVATDTPAATATRRRITFTPSPTGPTATRPTATLTSTVTLTPSATLAAGVPFTTFTADSTTLNAGQCTNLHWTSGSIQSIFLNNQAVTGAETRQVCPPAPTTYTLLAHTASGDISKQITITVNGGAPFTTFTSDATTLNAGQCTNLHWTSGNIQSIFLNGQGTVGTLDMQVCPTTSTVYTLLAHTSSGDISKQITITVNGGGPTATNTTAAGGPPQFSTMNVSSTVFYNAAACGPTTLTISVTVTNATAVTLNYGIAGGVSGIAPMNTSNNTDWSYTLHVNDTLEIPTQPTGAFTFSFKAQGPGGTVNSGTFGGVTLQNCP